ncbi:hypothetical protein V1503_24190 [Bacillus sp. SCS-151]|uniref:hypothetical protein n=1 Tax=Nanhaiella sioensis TaxID=3115293 RepID=UPI00397B01C7
MKDTYREQSPYVGMEVWVLFSNSELIEGTIIRNDEKLIILQLSDGRVILDSECSKVALKEDCIQNGHEIIMPNQYIPNRFVIGWMKLKKLITKRRRGIV